MMVLVHLLGIDSLAAQIFEAFHLLFCSVRKLILLLVLIDLRGPCFLLPWLVYQLEGSQSVGRGRCEVVGSIESG